MLGKLDEKMKNILHVLRRKQEVVVNTVVADRTAFILRSQNEHLKYIDSDSSYWTRSLFRCMGLQKEHAPPQSQKF